MASSTWTLPGQTLDGALTLDLRRLAPLSPLLGVDVDGPLTANVRLGGAVDRPAIELAARSPGLLVAGEHFDRLAFTGEVAGTPEAADGKLRLTVSSRASRPSLRAASSCAHRRCV